MKLKSFQRNHHKKEIRREEKGIRSQDWLPPALAVISWTPRVLLSLLSPLQDGQANPQLLLPALDSENCAQLFNMTRVLDSFHGGRELCGHWASWARGKDEQGPGWAWAGGPSPEESTLLSTETQGHRHNHVALIPAASSAGASPWLETCPRSSVHRGRTAWQMLE